MAKQKWVKPTRNINEKVTELLNFFGVASKKAWEKYYIDKDLKLSFRASFKNVEHAPALTAWLRHGQLQAQALENVPSYSKSLFLEKLNEIKEVMIRQPKDFFQQLKKLCLEAGVVVVYTPSLPSLPIHGATRWNKKTPIIQLTGRYKQNDIFWFTFFHEAGHILKHGKKYISLENVSYEGENKIFEKEADEFAISYTFSHEEEAKFLALKSLDDDTIKNFAKKNNIHPAMIVGRLQRKEIITYSEKRKFLVPIDLQQN